MTEKVYVVGSPGSRVVKIGRSTAPEKRLWALQVGSPVPLALLAAFEGGRVLEEALHQYFGACWKHGEWFELGDNPVEEVRTAVALGVTGMRSGRAVSSRKRQTLSPAQFRGVNWDLRFPPPPNRHVKALLGAHGIALDAAGPGEAVFHQCDAGRCVDCRTGRPAYLADSDFIVHETDWEARSWDERFPEVCPSDVRRPPLVQQAGAATA